MQPQSAEPYDNFLSTQSIIEPPKGEMHGHEWRQLLQATQLWNSHFDCNVTTTPAPLQKKHLHSRRREKINGSQATPDNV